MSNAKAKMLFGMLAQLETVYDSDDWNRGRDKVNQLEHCLQTATRAYRADASDEMVFIALMHDACRILAPIWHGEAIAEILRDCVSEEAYHILRTHGQFQDDILKRTAVGRKFKDFPWYSQGWHGKAKSLAVWDNASFDPSYESIPLRKWATVISYFCKCDSCPFCDNALSNVECLPVQCEYVLTEQRHCKHCHLDAEDVS